MRCILWGGTGQAKVVRSILESEGGHQVVAVFDNDPGVRSPFLDAPILGDWRAFERFHATADGEHGFVVTIGGVGRGEDRCALSDRLAAAGLRPLSPVHGRAFVAADARLGVGCQILAMSVVGVSARLDDYCIVNTGATVDHDCRLGRGVHVMPGATLAGEIDVGEHASIGANATVLPRLRIGDRAVVGAGGGVPRGGTAGGTIVGNPAQPRTVPAAP
jgi:sugar O-acyltransferase (sialic acid O-acetyltransferase NeuD family)